MGGVAASGGVAATMDGATTHLESGASDSEKQNQLEIESFQKIEGIHTIEQDLAATNPNFSTDSFEWSFNCQRCVSAYEARRRGYDVVAKPAKRGYDDLGYIYPVDKGVFSPYEGAEPIDVSANSGTQAELNINELMENWGEGARAIVCVYYKDEYYSGGHVFIAERIGGKTRYVDPQPKGGDPDTKRIFDNVKGQGVYCGRIDNLPFTPRIHECCENRKEIKNV